ncbi:hypothetical protein ACXPWS_16280 [Mycobacterium sp. BMJ-28]
MTLGDDDSRRDPFAAVLSAEKLADIALHRLQHRAHTGDADAGFSVSPFDLQRLMVRARNEALNGCVDRSGGLNGTWSGFRLAAFVAYYLVSHHGDYCAGTLPVLRRDEQAALGDVVLTQTNYLQACAIDLADAVIMLTEGLDAVSAPADLVFDDVTAIANSLNLVLAQGTDAHANEMVPTLQRQLHSLGATVEKGTSRRARTVRAWSRAWRRSVTSRRALAAAALIVVLVIAAIGYFGFRPAPATPPASAPERGGTTAAPVVRDVTERVDAATPDQMRSAATPWSITPQPIILDPANRDRSGVTVTVTLSVNPVRDRDVPVWLSFGRPGGLSYVPGETKMSNSNGQNQLQASPEPPPGTVPLTADKLRIPLWLAGDGTPTVFSTKLILNELQGPQQVDIPAPADAQPSSATVLRCGLNAVPFNVLLTGAESNGQWVNITIPLYVLKVCIPPR